ncbi:MAG: phosphatidylserine decarboxylase [Andreesenia angusta]|nr:phosphatidylserine decarboxylase [Andreesenia angusta]
MKIKYINRDDRSIKTEKVLGMNGLEFLYNNFLGKFILNIIVKRKYLSSIFGKFQDTKYSKKKIKSFVENYDINMDEFIRNNIDDYKSFNDFFYRKIKEEARPYSKEKNILISPADSRALFINNINKKISFPIKGFEFNLSNLIMDENLEVKFLNGDMAIFRLCPTDYHRYHFIDDSRVKKAYNIDGALYSVNPIALNIIKDLYSKNKRNLTLIETENFGDILYIEIGATFVGSIVQTYEPNFINKKGDEKGYFKFGGSTIILIFENNRIEFDKDLVENTKNGLETYIRAREKIGKGILT